MSDYHPPLDDMRFVLEHVVGLKDLPSHADMGEINMELVESVLSFNNRKRLQRGLRRISRWRLERRALHHGIWRYGFTMAFGFSHPRNVAGRKHVLRTLPVIEPRRSRSHPPSWLRRAKGRIFGEINLWRMDRHHEPDGATGRL